MSFGSPSPAPYVPPPTPVMAAPLSPATVKPPRKPMQPSFIGDLTPGPGQAQQRSLIGGANQPLGSAAY